MKTAGKIVRSSRRVALASALFALMSVSQVAAQGLVPTDFFNAPIDSAAPAEIAANALTFDSVNNVITANGDVVLRQGGYTLSGQSLTYNRATKDMRFIGAVSVLDPSGNLAETNDLDITGGMKVALVDALTITSYDGARITADSMEYDAALRTLMEQASYAPCGDCIDDNGQRIGWSVKASRITYDAADGSTLLEQPTLMLLGVPVAWLPYLWLPDLSAARIEEMRMPSYDYSEKIGHRLEIPYYAYSSRWTDVLLTPTFMTRQGFLLGIEATQRFANGSVTVKASGLYQGDKTAFTFTEAQRDWRGAIQTSGEFTPVESWTVGWSYSAFTDAAYLRDYLLGVGKSTVNQIYAKQLTQDTYFDARLQTFNQLGNVTAIDQGRQAQALPVVRFDHVEDLAPGMGRVEITGRLLGVRRESDSTGTYSGVPYAFGYAGNKQHASVQAGWQTQMVGAGGFVATPYLGGRTDFAYYDGSSAIGPGATSLWSFTPIAAMDVRFPVAANDGSTVHLIEPIGQLVYRGSNTTSVGITNDDAQSFVFDDTNLFSYNRFSGSDRQETGLRANIGGRYQANFRDGSYLEVIAGQSFQLAGSNAFSTMDQTRTGVGAGLEDAASYAVLGAYAGIGEGLSAGGKLQVDTTNPRVTRASLSAAYTLDRYSAIVDYTYLPPNSAAGTLKDQHQIGGGVTVPVAEYWSVKGSAYWDLVANSWLQVAGGLTYDDGYLEVGANATRNGPTHSSPDALTVSATFKIKAPAGLNLGYAGAVPLPQF